MLEQTQKDLAAAGRLGGFMPNAAEIDIIGKLANKIEQNGAAAAKKAQLAGPQWSPSNFMTAQRILQASRGAGQMPQFPSAPQAQARAQKAPQKAMMPPQQQGFGRTQ